MKRILDIIKTCLHRIGKAVAWYKGLYKGRAWYTRTLLAIVSTVVASFLYLGMVDTNVLWLFGKSPGFLDILQPPTYEASEIYSADGVLIGKFFKENRTPVNYSDVTPTFWKALIDTEDERFYEHKGIDLKGVAAAVKDAVTLQGGRGASTITQQLAKNMFRVRTNYSTGLLGTIPGLRMLIMKSKEWIIATKLEICYDKHQLLTMYANTVDFGNHAYGIKTAAKTYFDTTPDQLTTNQAAVLVGMLKATTTYNPILHPEQSRQRRNVVLGQMREHGHLSAAEYESLSAENIKLKLHTEENYDGQAQYFRAAVAEYLKDWTRNNGYDLYSSGLKIYTTIDTRMQKYAERSAARQMRQLQNSFDAHWKGSDPWRDERGRPVPGFIEKIAKRLPYYQYLAERYDNNADSISHYLNRPHRVKLFSYDRGTIYRNISTLDSIRYMVKFLHCGMVAMEPETGAVKAWVGDVDFSTWKYDKVTTKRQPGSTFKLFVYTEAMNQGLTPCDTRMDERVMLKVIDRKTNQEVMWTPSNANGKFTGDTVSLHTAFARSTNSIAVKLGMEVGIRNVIKTAHDMGITSELADEPSLALGSCDVSLLEMVNAYSTVAAGGKHHDPVLVEKIVDRNGYEVYIGPTATHKVLSYRTAFLVQQLLKASVNEPGGTSGRIRQYTTTDTSWGGKTGTTNNNSDGWFIAVSPKLVVGAWVGGEYRAIHFRSGALGQGARTALPLCGMFIQKVMTDSRFRRYHAQWPAADEMDVEPYMYMCSPERPSYEIPDSLMPFEETVEGTDAEQFDDAAGNLEPMPDNPQPENIPKMDAPAIAPVEENNEDEP